MDETDVASSTDLAAAVSSSSLILTHVWTTLGGVPGVTDWPNGEYRCQIDVKTVMNITGYGFRVISIGQGHFGRMDSVLGHSQTWTQDEAAFTGTGLKLATNTIDPSSGVSTDRFEMLLLAQNLESMDGTLTIRVDDSDSFANGPWNGV